MAQMKIGAQMFEQMKQSALMVPTKTTTLGGLITIRKPHWFLFFWFSDLRKDARW